MKRTPRPTVTYAKLIRIVVTVSLSLALTNQAVRIPLSLGSNRTWFTDSSAALNWPHIKNAPISIAASAILPLSIHCTPSVPPLPEQPVLLSGLPHFSGSVGKTGPAPRKPNPDILLTNHRGLSSPACLTEVLWLGQTGLWPCGTP